MEIIRHKNFLKDYKKLNKKQKIRVDKAIETFEQNPFNKKLRNHALKGKFQGFRSIDTGGDLRLMFCEQKKYITVVFVTVGLHSYLY